MVVRLAIYDGSPFGTAFRTAAMSVNRFRCESGFYCIFLYMLNPIPSVSFNQGGADASERSTETVGNEIPVYLSFRALI